MFGCLAGGKFSGECKRAVKRIKKRIDVIGKKKLAVVRFLKKDVADLLAAGHDSNAFGRMDALITEINKMSCYEMIENFCEIILNQLPSLQKQRECPQGALEAVSTLIFAAARFPDLPELCDLRHVFTERYGDHMESSVNVEFVERNQKKAFSKEKKLHMMQSIAEEFSVKWDSWAFQDKWSASPEAKYEPPKKVVPFHSPNDATQQLPAKSRKETPPKNSCEPNPKSVAQRQVQAEPKDNYVFSTASPVQLHATVEKTKKVISSEMENVEPYQTSTVLYSFDNPKSVAQRQVQAEPKDNYVFSTASPVQLHATVEKTKKVISSEMENVEPYQTSTVLYSFDNPRNNQKENYGNDHPKKNSRYGTGKLQELDPSSCEKQGICTKKSWNENSVPPHNNPNRSKDRCQVAEKSTNAGWLGHTENEMQPIGVLKNRSSTANMVPPYVKPSINDSLVHDDLTMEKPNSTAHGKPYGIYVNQNENVFDGRTIMSNSFQRQSKNLTVAESERAVEIKDKAVPDEKYARQTSREERHTSRQSADSYTGYHDEGKTRIRHPRQNNDYEMGNQRRYKSKHSAGINGENYDEGKTRTRLPREPFDYEMDKRRRHTSRRRETNDEDFNIQEETMTMRWIRHQREPSDDEMGYCRRHTSKQRETNDDEMDSQRRYKSKSASASGEYYDEGKTRTRHQREPTDDERDYCRRHTSRERETNDNEMDYQQIRYKSKRGAGTNGEYYDEGKARTRHQREPIDDEMYHRRRDTNKRTGTNGDSYDGGNARARPPTEWTDDEGDHAMDYGTSRERETNDNEMDYQQIRYKSKRSAGTNGEYYDEGKARTRHQREPIDDEMYHRRRDTNKRTGTNGDSYDGGNARARPPTEWTDDEVDHAMDYGTNKRTGTKWTDDEVDHAMDYGTIISGKSTGCGRNWGTLNAATYDEYDEEEIVVDRLLFHYSSKGTSNERINKTKRTFSLPPEAVASSEVLKVPARAARAARAASMQPDLRSPNGRLVHPRLPEYDGLAARLSALRKE